VRQRVKEEEDKREETHVTGDGFDNGSSAGRAQNRRPTTEVMMQRRWVVMARGELARHAGEHGGSRGLWRMVG